MTYSDAVPYTNFDGVVTFSNGTFSSGGTAIDGSSNSTSIDGGNIKTGSVTADSLTIGNIAVGTNTNALKLYPDALKIFASGNLRVKIGNLGNTTDE